MSRPIFFYYYNIFKKRQQCNSTCVLDVQLLLDAFSKLQYFEGKTGMYNTNFSLVRIEGLHYFKEPFIGQFYKVSKMVMKIITLEFPYRNMQFLILSSLKWLVASRPGRWGGAQCPPFNCVNDLKCFQAHWIIRVWSTKTGEHKTERQYLKYKCVDKYQGSHMLARDSRFE